MTDNSQTDFFLPPALVARALSSLAEFHHTAIDRLSEQTDQGDPSVKEEIAYHLHDYNAFIKASFEWGRGIRPILTPRGSWLVPSRTTGGVIYEVEKPGGFWRCGPNCKAVGSHWHTALILGIDRAIELAGDEDDGDCWNCDGAGCDVCDGSPLTDAEVGSQTDPDEGSQLGRRLALARAAAMDFNRDVFGAAV